jgi:hypothetical protein
VLEPKSLLQHGFSFEFTTMKSEAFLYTFALLVSIFRVDAVNTAPGYVLEDASNAEQPAEDELEDRRLEAVETEVCEIPTPPGAFPPALTYRYLKVPAPLIYTQEKAEMGGSILLIRNAAKPLVGDLFTCRKEAGEWKARIKDPRANILTLELSRGEGAANDVTRVCLLQDISIHRTHNQLALRLDYGYCPRPHTETEQAFIMVGLQVVPDGRFETPGLGSFFEGICDGGNSSTVALDLKKAQAYHDSVQGYQGDTCFAGSADTLVMESVGKVSPSGVKTPCFTKATAYTWLTEDDEAGVLPISESEYRWLMDKLPAIEPTVMPIRTYGKVIADRACIFLDGIKTRSGKQCNNGCGKWCLSGEEDSSLGAAW